MDFRGDLIQLFPLKQEKDKSSESFGYESAATQSQYANLLRSGMNQSYWRQVQLEDLSLLLERRDAFAIPIPGITWENEDVGTANRIGIWACCARLIQNLKWHNSPKEIPLIVKLLLQFCGVSEWETIPIPLISGDKFPEQLESLFGNLYPTISGESQRDLRVAWDLALSLGEEALSLPEATSRVRVLGVGTTFDLTTIGFVGKLTVEWIPDQGKDRADFLPHPAMFFLPCDIDFRAALASVITWVSRENTIFTGWLRWRVERDDTEPLSCLTGNSLGLALGVASHFALNRQQFEDDLTIAVSARLDSNGSLKPVGGIPEKVKAAYAMATGMDRLGAVLTTVLVFNNPGFRSDATFEVISVKQIRDVLELYSTRNRVRLELLKLCGRRFGEIDVIGQKEPAAMKAFYLAVPLLKEIRVEQLPARDLQKESESVADSGGIAPLLSQERMRRAPLNSWTEETNFVRFGVDPVDRPKTVAQIFEEFAALPGERARVPRLIILGNPGSGKTTLVRYLSWAASPESGRESLTWRGRPLIPAYVRLASWKASGKSLVEYLAREYLPASLSHEEHAQMGERWTQWMQRGDVLLMLDGLDEVAGDREFLKNEVAPCVRPEGATGENILSSHASPVILTCRLISREALGQLGLATEASASMTPNRHPIFRPTDLSPSSRKAYIETYFHHFGEQEDQPDERMERVRATIEKDEVYRFLSANPMLLSLICFVGSIQKELPRTRTELYEVAVSHLLKVAPVANRQIPGTFGCRRSLEMLALAMMLETKYDKESHVNLAVPSLSINWRDAEEELRIALAKIEKWESGTGIGEASDVLAYLSSEAKILSASDRGPLMFLHLTVQEYLAACALSTRAEMGWEEPPNSILNGEPNKNKTGWQAIRGTVDRYSWLNSFQEVFIFLTGRLRMTLPSDDKWRRSHRERRLSTLCDLLEFLGDPKNNDLHEHRLALAAICIPEIVELQRSGKT